MEFQIACLRPHSKREIPAAFIPRVVGPQEVSPRVEENPELMSVTLGFLAFTGKRSRAPGLVYTRREWRAGSWALSPGPSPQDMGDFVREQ